MKKIAYDGTKLDALKIVEDSKCCLKVNAVITKEGVYPYPDGRAFKSRMELLRATHTAQNAKVTIMDHPDSMVIMSQSQIYGTVEKPFFDRDKIRATISFDKRVCPPRFLYDVRNGKLKDVSIGFYYQPDLTPGTWNGQAYDYVMRDIVIDHVAAGVIKGRCTFPDCGIGVDAMMRDIASKHKIGLDPFGDYTDFADCVAKNQDKSDPEAYCASVHRKITGKWPSEDSYKIIGGKKLDKKSDFGLSQTPEEIQAEFAECVRQRMEEGMTQGEAEAHCQAATKPEDEPAPPPGIDTKQPPAKDQADVVEETPLQRCVSAQIEQGKSEEEATEWCKAELSGEHQETDALIGHSQKLLRLREQRNIERRRESRRSRL